MTLTVENLVEIQENAITTEQFFDFVKKNDTEILNDPVTISSNTSHYLKQFKKHGHKKFFLSFNWAFIFFDTTWLVYRKMYWAFGFKIMSLASILALEHIQTSPLMQNSNFVVLFYILVTLFVIVMFTFNFTGNMIYFAHIRHHIRKKNYHKKGVSKIAVLISCLLFFINVFAYCYIKAD